MIIRLFKSNHIVLSGFVFLVSLLLHIPVFIHSQEYAHFHSSLILGNLFFELDGYGFVFDLLALVLVALQAIYFNYLIERFGLMRKHTYLPALFFVIFSCVFPEFLGFFQGILANFLLLFSLNRLLSISSDNSAFSPVFDALLILSFASFFYFPVIIFSLVAFAALYIYRPFHWREWVIGLIGFALPYVFAWVYCYISDREYLLANHIRHTLDLTSSWPQFQYLSNYFLLIVLIVLFLLGIMSFIRSLNQNKVRVRKGLQIFICLLIVSFISPIIFSSYGSSVLIFSVIPFSLYFSSYFLELKNQSVAEVLLIIFLSIIVINQLNYTA